MHRLTAFLQKTALTSYTPLTNTEPTDPAEWKARLAEQLPSLHERSPFDQLIGDYLTEDKKPDLSLLVCGCMKNGNVDVLAYILANEDMKRLCIEGPVGEQGWKTLAAAMPERLLVAELVLSKETLDASKGELLFKVLGRMPALETLCLRKIEVEGGFFFDRLKCPDLPLLKLEVSTHSKSEAGVYPLLRKILGACQVRRLSIEDFKASSTSQHSGLAKALGQQRRLDSLRFGMEYSDTPKQFECYMPFLCSKTPLVELDLSGCCIGVLNFNQLVEALSQNQPTLKSLLLSNCSVGGKPKSEERVSINISPLVEMKSLRHLDLGDNGLPINTTVALLTELKKSPNRLVNLSLGGNLIGKEVISAMASFLQDNDTLRRLSFEQRRIPKYLRGIDEVFTALTEAVEHNLVLQELVLHSLGIPADYLKRLTRSLERNRQLVIAPAMRGGVCAIGKSHYLRMPYEIGDLVFEHGLAPRDALRLSSVNKDALEFREKFLRDEVEQILRSRLE
jgi:hypothetical protein